MNTSLNKQLTMTPLNLVCSSFLYFVAVFNKLDSVEGYISYPDHHHNHHWQPDSSLPSTNNAKISDITSPDELMDFVMMDDRPCIIKVYTNWCRTCKQFDVRFKKVASIWGEQKISERGGGGGFSNRARFAQMEYSRNEELCKLLEATKVPYILIYTREEGLVSGFTCPPRQVQRLIDALHQYAPSINEEDDDLPLMVFSDEVTFETLLSGSKMIDTMMPEIQQDAGYDTTSSDLSFEEFCKKHTSKDV